MTRIIVVDDLSRFALGGSEHLALADDVIVSWNTFSSASNIPVDAQVIHLGDALHDKEDELQQSLLQWLGALADRHTSTESPLPFVFTNLHSWWLLKVSEKNYATTPELTTLLKLALLRDICESTSPNRCDYLGADKKLESALGALAGTLRIPTNARADAQPVSLGERLEVPQAIFHFLKAFSFSIANSLRRLRALRRDTRSGDITNGGMLGFVGYLLPTQTADRAHSPYWGALRESFNPGQRSFWLYHRSDEVSWRDGRSFCAKKSSDREIHRLIDDFITPRIVLRSVATYSKLMRARKSFSLDVPRHVASLGGLGAEHLFETSVRDSLAGSHAVWATIHAHTYDSLVRLAGVTRWFFLWENKAFEHSLVSAARRHGDIQSVGYAHSVVRKRDHRYYNELRTSPATGVRARPTASLYAVNGPLPLANIDRIGAPDAPVRVVEALRYLSLAPRRGTPGSDVLIVGDISSDESRRLVVATVDAVGSAGGLRRIIFKPHPGNLSQSEMARSLGCEVTTQPLADLAPSLEFAVVGVAGAASLDLTMLDVPVVTLLDAATLNLSPLAGVDGAVFARTTGDLRRFAEHSSRGTVKMDSVMTRSRPPVLWTALLAGSL